MKKVLFGKRKELRIRKNVFLELVPLTFSWLMSTYGWLHNTPIVTIGDAAMTLSLWLLLGYKEKQ